jgi:hypothetical protein
VFNSRGQSVQFDAAYAEYQQNEKTQQGMIIYFLLKAGCRTWLKYSKQTITFFLC